MNKRVVTLVAVLLCVLVAAGCAKKKKAVPAPSVMAPSVMAPAAECAVAAPMMDAMPDPPAMAYEPAKTVSAPPMPAPSPSPNYSAPGLRPPVATPPPAGEAYEGYRENDFANPKDQPLSTFSIDVDTASYTNMRRFVKDGALPPKEAIRIEEFINYFEYSYPGPVNEGPFAVSVETASCPWNAEHQIARVGLKGREIDNKDRPASNLVFLIDVSGSMSDENKLPLIQKGLLLLVPQLRETDHVAIVTYAGEAGVALDSTPCTKANQRVIMEVINALSAGGSTQGSAGLSQAYGIARANFISKGTNRVILASDGDFNVGITNRDALVQMIEKEAKSDVFLSVLGFGMGNIKDATLEQLADKGNGQYAYVDTLSEAHRIFLQQMSASLVTIAKDVKIQIEFNPAVVGAYRLVGYENRMMKAEEFNDDSKDAGEIGAGHTVTALYEIVPVGGRIPGPNVDELRYQQNPKPAPKPQEKATDGEMMNVKIRYKAPRSDESALLTFPVGKGFVPFNKASEDMRFATAVAAFGQILRDSKYKGNITLNDIEEIALSSRGEDEYGHRVEFVNIVRGVKANHGQALGQQQ